MRCVINAVSWCVLILVSVEGVRADTPSPLVFNPVGGSMVWDQTAPNWWNGNTCLQGTWVDTQYADFGGTSPYPGTPGTVEVPGNVGSVGGIIFEQSGYTLNGGTITMTGSEIRTSYAATINSVIAGSNGLSKTGPAGLTLSAANTFTGPTSIAGSIVVGHENALRNSTVTIGTSTSYGSHLYFDATVRRANIGGLAAWYSSSDSFSLTNSASEAVALTVGSNNESTTIGIKIVGAGSLTKVGTGTLTLDRYSYSDNTYTGDTKVVGGTLALSPNALSGSTLDYDNYGGVVSYRNQSAYSFGGLKGNQSLGLPNVMAATGPALLVGWNDQSTTYGGVLSGSGGVEKVGNGTWTLTGASTFTGDTKLAGGTIRIDNPNALQSSCVTKCSLSVGFPGQEQIIYAGGNLVFGNVTTATVGGLGERNGPTGQSFDLALVNESGTPVALRVGNDTFYQSWYVGNLSGSGSLTKFGSNNQVLSSACTYTGTTTVEGGYLNVYGSLANNGSDHVFVAAKGTQFGSVLFRSIAANKSFAGFGSTAIGGNTVGSTADLLDGAHGGVGTGLTMRWRERAAADLVASVVSDVFGLSSGSTSIDYFTLKMSYSANELPGGAAAETSLAIAGLIDLMYYNTTTNLWENAVLENIGINDMRFMGVGVAPDGILGHYGIDPTTDTVWAVINHLSDSSIGGQFAVAVAVPEPSTIGLLAAGLLGVLVHVWRKRR
ncbi:MAG: autotransporter-associated beta strand repeat-containing protein [Planctomycetaceae bacterium]|nr:autotransporter-associated beta strand repeat-containing protein [Planctomycetaceae bacterium]